MGTTGDPQLGVADHRSQASNAATNVRTCVNGRRRCRTLPRRGSFPFGSQQLRSYSICLPDAALSRPPQSSRRSKDADARFHRRAGSRTRRGPTGAGKADSSEKDLIRGVHIVYDDGSRPEASVRHFFSTESGSAPLARICVPSVLQANVLPRIAGQILSQDFGSGALHPDVGRDVWGLSPIFALLGGDQTPRDVILSRRQIRRCSS